MLQHRCVSRLWRLLRGGLVLVSVPLGVSAQASLHVIGAEHMDSNHVKFALETFAWETSAPSALRRLEGTVPNAALRVELRSHDNGFGSAEFSFLAPAPDTLRALKYLLVHAGGLTPLRLDSLRGTARVLLPDSKSALGPVQFYGEAHASPTSGRGPLGGGFVLIGSLTLEATITPSQRTADELLGPHGADYFARGTPFWSIRKQFAFAFKDHQTQYLFVQWAPDEAMREAGCQYRFSLFRLGPTPTQVASLNYGCDV